MNDASMPHMSCDYCERLVLEHEAVRMEEGYEEFCSEECKKKYVSQELKEIRRYLSENKGETQNVTIENP